MVTEDIHYFRNNLNRAPATRDELIAEKEKWKLLPVSESTYHMFGEDGLFNTKFISAGDGKYEGVYDKDGLLLTEKNDPVNMGTYNYCSTSINSIIHWKLDLLTYIVWGNVEGCKANIWARDIKDFWGNQEAVEEYMKVKAQMESE